MRVSRDSIDAMVFGTVLAVIAGVGLHRVEKLEAPPASRVTIIRAAPEPDASPPKTTATYCGIPCPNDPRTCSYLLGALGIGIGLLGVGSAVWERYGGGISHSVTSHLGPRHSHPYDGR